MTSEPWRRRLTLKIVLLGLGAALPLLASTIFYFVTYANRDLRFLELEQEGIRCLRPLNDLLRLVPAHHASLQPGATGATPGQLQAEINQRLAEIETATAGLNRRLSAGNACTIAELQRNWTRLLAGQPIGSAAEIAGHHAGLLGEVRSVMHHIGQSSNLILDPELPSYRLADTLVEVLPGRQELLARSLIAAHAPARSGQTDRIFLAAKLEETNKDQIVTELTLRSPLDHYATALLALRAELERSDPSVPATGEGRLIVALQRAHAASFPLWTAAGDELERLLVLREARLVRHRTWSLVFMATALLSSGLLTGAVGRSISRRTKAEHEAAQNTARHNAELEKRVAERTAQLAKFARAIEQSPVAVMITDRHGTIEFVNPRFTQVTGFEAAETIGRNPRLLKSGVQDAAIYRNLWGTILQGQIWQGELANRKKNGELFWEQLSIAPLRDAADHVTHFVAVSEDITEQKRIAESLHEAKTMAESANRAKSTFLAHMSHEIRTPLNAILGFSQLLLRDPSLSTTQRDYLQTVDRNGEHLLALINDVLEMSKIEAHRVTLKARPFSPPQVARELHSMFQYRAEAKGLAFSLTLDPDLPAFLVGDVHRLRQILINLLGNAIKFTMQGQVTLRMRAIQESAQEWRLLAEVVDTGPGISQADLGRLFQQFEQADNDLHPGAGTGLGLAISREFARMLGGDITVESAPGRGSTFRVEVRLGAAPDAADKLSLPKTSRQVIRLAAEQPVCRILIVDDLEDNRRLLNEMMKAAGFALREAFNGSEAITAFEIWQPHCILMDLRMPVMGGIEAIQRIRALSGGERVKIIALSASVIDEHGTLARAAGADDFLGKPFRNDELFAKLGVLLDLNYLYQDELPAGPGPQPAPTLVGTGDFHLPAGFAAPLRQALEEADLDAVLAQLNQLEAVDPALAREFRHHAERFQYEHLLKLLPSNNAP